MEQLLRSLRSPVDDSLTCWQSRELMPELALASAEVARGDPEWIALGAHLEQCPACSTLWAELLALDELDEAEVALAAAAPAPDLSFARRAPLFAVRIASLSEAVISFGQGLVTAVEQAFAPQPFATQRAQLVEYAGKIPNEQTEHLFSATVQVRRSPTAADHCTLLVTVVPPGKAWPDLAGTLVTMHGSTAPAAPVETDSYGVVSFADVPLVELPALSLHVELLPE